MATIIFALMFVGLLSVFALDIRQKVRQQTLEIHNRSSLRRR